MSTPPPAGDKPAADPNPEHTWTAPGADSGAKESYPPQAPGDQGAGYAAPGPQAPCAPAPGAQTSGSQAQAPCPQADTSYQHPTPAPHPQPTTNPYGYAPTPESQIPVGPTPGSPTPGGPTLRQNNGYLPGLDPHTGQWTYAQPGIIPLRPLNLGNIISAPFSLLRFAFVKLVSLALLLSLPLVILMAVLFASVVGMSLAIFESGAGSSFVLEPYSIVIDSAALLFTTFFASLIAPAVMAASSGKNFTVRGVFSAFIKRIPKTFLLTLVMVGTYLPFSFLYFAFDENHLWIATLILWPVKTLILLFFGVSAAVISIENTSVTDSLKETKRILKSNFWTALGGKILVGILSGLIFYAILLSLGIVGIFAIAAVLTTTDSVAISLVIGIIFIGIPVTLSYAVAIPLNGAVYSLIYIDGRFRLDGTDIEWLNNSEVNQLAQGN